MNLDSSNIRGKLYFTVIFLPAMTAITLFFITFSACSPHIKSRQNTIADPVLPLEVFPAKAYHEKGTMEFKKGAFGSAIKNWIKSEKLFQEQGKTEKQSMVLVELSQAYQAVGLNKNARESLEEALILAENSGNRHHQAIVLAHLGNQHTLLGNQHQAEQELLRSLRLSKGLDKPGLEASILNNQGNLLLAGGHAAPARSLTRKTPGCCPGLYRKHQTIRVRIQPIIDHHRPDKLCQCLFEK